MGEIIGVVKQKLKSKEVPSFSNYVLALHAFDRCSKYMGEHLEQSN